MVSSKRNTRRQSQPEGHPGLRVQNADAGQNKATTGDSQGRDPTCDSSLGIPAPQSQPPCWLHSLLTSFAFYKVTSYFPDVHRPLSVIRTPVPLDTHHISRLAC